MEKLFNERLTKLTDLLKYKFKLIKNTRPDLVDGNIIKVPIMLRDVEDTNIDHRDFRMLLDQIAQNTSGVKITEVFDYDNLPLGVMEHNKDAFGYELPFAIVLLPTDFIESFNEESSNKVKNKDPEEIEKIEVLEDETRQKRITIYINTNYEDERNYKRGINWGLMYDLAEGQSIRYKRGFYNYFNSNKTNPLYSKGDFKVKQILREEGGYIFPIIEIKLITKKAISQRRKLKSA